MKLNLTCKLCKIYISMSLKQFEKKKDSGLFIHNLKCINCGEVYKILDLIFGEKD